MGKKSAKMYRSLRTAYTEQGDHEALARARALLDDQKNLTLGDNERLFGYLEGGGRVILVEPEARLTKASKVPGLDGQKMSKSYNNTIKLRDDPERLEKTLRAMPTDPARVRRTDPGEPGKCPVWQFHLIYSNEEVCNWVEHGCTTAAIRCLDCKGPLIDSLIKEQNTLRKRAEPYVNDPGLVRNIISDGCERAREVAEETMREVRENMGLDWN